MDYEFTFNEYDRPIAEFSMGHEALGRWLSDECKGQQEIDEQLDIIQQLEQCRIHQRQLIGADFQLRLGRNEVEVIALALEIDRDETLPEDTSLYDDESYAECGLQDFKHVLLSWQEFIDD